MSAPARPPCSHALTRVPLVLNATRKGLAPDRLPAGAVYIGRRARNGWPDSKWRNAYREGRDGSRADVVAKHRAWLCDTPEGAALLADIHELRGRDLVCWCAPEPCHGDVLLDLANADDPGDAP